MVRTRKRIFWRFSTRIILIDSEKIYISIYEFLIMFLLFNSFYLTTNLIKNFITFHKLDYTFTQYRLKQNVMN